jgi:hypothetical protein
MEVVMRALVAALLLGCVVTAPADAQFGIGKRVKNAAANAVGAGGAGGKVETGRVAFDADVLEITEARLAQLLKGLEAESQVIARMQSPDQERVRTQNEALQQNYDKARADYDRRQAVFERCAEPEQKRGEADMRRVAAGAPDSAAMKRIADRMLAARNQGNMTELQRLADSVGRASMAISSRAQTAAQGGNDRIVQKCGQPPVEPEQPTMAPLLSASDVRAAGLTASGFTDRQYAIMRERILPFVNSKGRTSAGVVYTAGEAGVLNAHVDDLAKYVELFQRY